MKIDICTIFRCSLSWYVGTLVGMWADIKAENEKLKAESANLKSDNDKLKLKLPKTEEESEGLREGGDHHTLTTENEIIKAGGGFKNPIGQKEK